MALHIADSEVDQLVADLAQTEGISKTELLRRVLKKEKAQREQTERRKGLAEFMRSVIEDARKRKLRPVAKKEIDTLYN